MQSLVGALPGRDTIPHADEISWTLRPIERPEDDNPVDLFALDHTDLLAFTFGLQDDLCALRALLHEALAALADANVRSDRSHVRILALVGELREARAEARALHAQLRATQERAA
jgi:hypothetical protein